MTIDKLEKAVSLSMKIKAFHADVQTLRNVVADGGKLYIASDWRGPTYFVLMPDEVDKILARIETDLDDLKDEFEKL